MCFVWISEQTGIISLYNINWLLYVTQTECVYCAVRTGCLRVINVRYQLKSADCHNMYTWRLTTYHESETLCSCCHQVTLRWLESREGRKIFLYSAACRPVLEMQCVLGYHCQVRAVWVCQDDHVAILIFTGANAARTLHTANCTSLQAVRWQEPWQQVGVARRRANCDLWKSAITHWQWRHWGMMMMMMMMMAVTTSFDCTKFEFHRQ